MNHDPTTCDPERIELFLQQRLSRAEQIAFELHLDDCEDCRRRLKATAASEEVWGGVEDFLRDQPLPPDDLLSEDFGSATGENTSSGQATILNLLAPTDDDRMLGRWGTYEVMGVVGTGGMGVVLKAFDAALNRYVAIKILAPHLGSSGSARRRFSREAQASAAVVHDNVIEIYGVAEAAGLPYLVMPYVRGPSLHRRLDDQGPLAVAEILRVGMQAAAGLAAAHAQGLVHRDVKPANILLADGIERVKLTDFGLARAADDASLTKTGIIAGTPQYMSPEQSRGEPVDQRSDLFSLGSVLYAMCTGRPPFRAETSYGVLRRITDEEPRPIREINPEIPEWLCGIVAKLMAKRPSDRFQSSAEVAELLEECLAHVQQPTVVPLPAYSPLPPGEGPGVRAVDSSLPAGNSQGVRAAPRSFMSRKPLLTGTLAMLTLIGISLFAAGVVSTNPPDISGDWQGEDWGHVTLMQTAPGEYTGTYTDTVAKEKGPGKIDLKWSRIERRFNGMWREGEDDRFGDLSVHMVDKEICGALTTSAKSKINPATPRLAEVIWTRAIATVGAAANPASSSTGAKRQDNGATAEAVATPGADPVIDRVTVDPDKAVIEGRASKNDKIVFVFGEKETMSQAFPSPVHFKCTIGEGEVGGQWGPVARVTDADGKELPDMPAQILPVIEPVFVRPSDPAMNFQIGSLHFRGAATRRPDGTVIVADCWAHPGDSFGTARMPFGAKLISAARKSEKERTGVTLTGRVLTEPGGTGVAGVKVGIWGRDAVTAADGTYSFDDVPRSGSPGYYTACIKAAPDLPPGVWSEAVSVAVEQQDVHAHDLYLKFPQSISGIVRDADTNQPIAGAEIQFSSNESGPRALVLGPSRKVTDADGRYRLYLRPREVTVSCDGTPDRYNRDSMHGQRAVVAEPQQETTVDFCCVSGAPLTGRVVNPDGTPAKDARVRVSVGWPVRVEASLGSPAATRGGASRGAGGARAGRGGRGIRAGRGAGGGFDLSVPRTENRTDSFETKTDADGRFNGYMRQPELPDDEYERNFREHRTLQNTLPVSIKARAWLPDRSLGGVGRAEAPFAEPLAQPLVVKLQKTGAAVVRVLFQDGRPVPDAEIRIDGSWPDSDLSIARPLGKPAENLGDGRYRIAGLTAGLDYRLRAFRRKLPTRTETGKLDIKPGQTTDAGELRLEWEEELAHDAQPRFRLDQGGQVNQVAFSPDGTMLATRNYRPASAIDPYGYDVKLVDVATGKILETGRIPADCMAFLPKLDVLALGCSDGTLILTKEKKLTTWKSFPISSESIYPVAVSANGAMVACATGDGTVDCWDVMSGRKLHSLVAKENQTAGLSSSSRTSGLAFPNQMVGLAFSPDNKLLVAVDRKGLFKAWDLESEKESGSFQGVHSDTYQRVAFVDSVPISFCPDGKTAAISFTSYNAEPLRFWDPRGGKPPVLVSLPDAIQPKPDPDSSGDGRIIRGPGHTVLSPDCKIAATVLYSGWVAVWDVPSRRVFQVLPNGNWEGNTLQFRGLAFSPDGRLLATGNEHGVVEVWEIDTAAREAKRKEAPAVALPDYMKTGEEQSVPSSPDRR